MGQFITLNKQDREFDKYLDGTFSKDIRAIPQQSLNVNTIKEQVTFKLIPIADIKKPNIFVLFYRLFRLDWLSLTLGPVLATYSYLYTQGIKINHFDALLSLLAVVLFHSSVFALNDYKDHIKGVDRLNFIGGSQVIQSGWLSANFVKQLGVLLFGLATFFGTLLIYQQPFYLIAVGAFVLFSVLGYSFWGQGLKYLGFGEVISFFCFGSMLTYGFSRAAGMYHSPEIILLGIPFGHLAAVSLHSRQLENIMSDSQVGVKTMVVRLGFDRAKSLLQIQFLLSPILFVATILALKLSYSALFLFIPYFYFSYRLYKNLKATSSSFSSSMQNFKLRVVDLHIILSTLMLIAFWLK